MKSAGHRTKELKVIPVSASATVNYNDTTIKIFVPTPTGMTTVLGAPIVCVIGSTNINYVTAVLPLDDNNVRVISTLTQNVTIRRLFIGY